MFLANLFNLLFGMVWKIYHILGDVYTETSKIQMGSCFNPDCIRKTSLG